MNTRLLQAIAFATLATVKPAVLCSQEFKLLDRTVQVHGFASQGFIATNQNNWLSLNTSTGSFAITDFGVNVSS